MRRNLGALGWSFLAPAGLGMADAALALLQGPATATPQSVAAALVLVFGLAALAAVPLLVVELAFGALARRLGAGGGAAAGFVLVGAAAGARAANALLYVRQYPWAHALLTLGTVVVAVAGLTLLRPGPRSPRRSSARLATRLAAAALLLALAQEGLVHERALAHALLRHTTDVRQGLDAVMWLFDGDGDGTSDAFGGGDCDDTDAAVSPARRERPDNGIDDNCVAGDAPAPAADGPRAPVRPGSPGPRGDPPLDLVLLGIDALRLDRVAAAGARRSRVPTLDRLVASGEMSLLTGLRSSACWTMPALRSAWSAAHPSEVRWTPVGVGQRDEPVYDGRLDSQMWTRPFWNKAIPTPVLDRHLDLPAVLRDAGYRTVAVVSHIFFGKGYGVTDAFERVDDTPLLLQSTGKVADAAEVVTRGVIESLRASDGRPSFVWAHYLDPHQPRHRHPEVAPELGDSDEDRYDAELMRTDAFVGAVVRWLRETGRLDRTLLVVMSDHGEEFGDHGGEFHASSLYEEIVRVPLFVRIPGVPGRLLAERSTTVDLSPTLLELLRVPAPPGWRGRSLAPSLLGLPQPARGDPYDLLECSRFQTRLRALVDDRHKLVLDQRLGLTELYDLHEDPYERRNLIDERLEVKARLLGELGRRLDGLEAAWWRRHGIEPPP